MKGAPDTDARTAWTQNPRVLGLIVAITLAFFGLSSYLAWNTFWNPARKQAKYKKVSKPRWSDLSAMQRDTLAPLAGEWDHISASGKKTWLIMADRIALKSPEAKARAQKRIQAWAKMTPEQRNIIRTNYALAKKKLKPTEKMARWQNYQQLSDEQRQELAAAKAAGEKAENKQAKKTEGGTQVAHTVKPATDDEADESNEPVKTEAQEKQPAAS